MEKLMVQHIAYYNDPEDIKELMDKDAKSIVKYYKKNQGNLWSSGDLLVRGQERQAHRVQVRWSGKFP